MGSFFLLTFWTIFPLLSPFMHSRHLALLQCVYKKPFRSRSLFINKRFALNEMFQRNASKFAIFYMYKKTHVVFFFVFHFVQLYILPYECHGLCRHRRGHSLGKNVKLHEIKNEKNYVGFLIHKI